MIWLKSASNRAVTIAVGVAQFGRFGVVFLHACSCKSVFAGALLQEYLCRSRYTGHLCVVDVRGELA